MTENTRRLLLETIGELDIQAIRKILPDLTHYEAHDVLIELAKMVTEWNVKPPSLHNVVGEAADGFTFTCGKDTKEHLAIRVPRYENNRQTILSTWHVQGYVYQSLKELEDICPVNLDSVKLLYLRS